MKKFRCAIVGATGTVGQRLVALLARHEWFCPAALLASSRSAGRRYGELMRERWQLPLPVPEYARDMPVLAADDPAALEGKVDFVFFAADLPPEKARALEESYAKCEFPVVSNGAASRLVPDVPMVIPEINPGHLAVIPAQRERLGTKRGFIATKSNCSLQSYVPLLTPLLPFGLRRVKVCTLQAVSGAGKTLESFPEIQDNVIPFIRGEEEKCETEPLKIWGKCEGGKIVLPKKPPKISAQCLRVPVSEGHLAAVFAEFSQSVSKERILAAWNGFSGEPQRLRLPSAPKKFIRYFEEDDRPQPKTDRSLENGMAVAAGRLRGEGNSFRFIGLSHNTLRGAAGGAVLLAELLAAKGYLG